MKEKHFKTIFPAVAVPLNNDYTINEPEFRAYLRWIKTFYNKGIKGLVLTVIRAKLQVLPVLKGNASLKSAPKNVAIS